MLMKQRLCSKSEFRAARLELDMSAKGCADLLGITRRRIVDWEDETKPHYQPSAMACRIIGWMLELGFRPPEYRPRTKFGRKPKEMEDQADNLIKAMPVLGTNKKA